jgi:hypothetical protein
LGAVPSSDPFGFSNASDRLEEARRLGIGKPERAMVRLVLHHSSVN